MGDENQLRIRNLFMDVADLPPADRGAVLGRLCAGDRALRHAVDALLDAHDSAGSFMDNPAAQAPPFPEARLLGNEQADAWIDRYKLLHQIGEGGFGSVWMAEQREPVKRRVALKVIKLGMDTRQVIARFEAERQALAMMDHPNIARVFDAGATESGRPYFVMELVRGMPITAYCDHERLDTAQRLELFIDVCHAIQHAHQKGVIHRDIKPSNVLVTLHDTRPVPKVIDFGIAKATSAELTQHTLFTEHHQAIGTPAYMSPEQAAMSGLDIDTRSDIYALGVLLYELLTGATPFAPETSGHIGYPELLRIIREQDPKKPSTKLSSLGPSAARAAELRRVDPRRLCALLKNDLDWIAMKCLEKDRERRYESANALAEDLRRHLRDEPVTAGPPGTSYRLRKFVRRNRGRVIASAAALTLLVLGTVGTGVGLRQSIIEQRRALAAEADAELRASELEIVSAFQSAQLDAVNPSVMGARIRSELLEHAGEPAGAQLERYFTALNFTTIALRTLDENIFERTLRAIGEQFADQPVIRARLLHTVGVTMRDLGLIDRAVAPLTEAIELRTAASGREHPDTLMSSHELGVLQLRRGSNDEAARIFADTFQARRRALGPDHPDTLQSLYLLGIATWSLDNIQQAEQHLLEAFRGFHATLGADHPRTLALIATTDISIGVRVFFGGDREEAATYYREATENLRRILGETHPDTIESMRNVATLLRTAGNPQEAEDYTRTALNLSRAGLGDEHPETINLISQMATLHWHQGRVDEAEPYLREAYETRRRVLGDRHPSTRTSLNEMASLLNRTGRLDESERLLREAIDLHRLHAGENDIRLVAHVVRLAGFLDRHGRIAEALPDLEAIERLARGYYESRDEPESLAIYLHALARARAASPFDADRFAAAESALLQAHEAFISGQALDRARAAALDLADLYERWERQQPGRGYGARSPQWRVRAEPD